MVDDDKKAARAHSFFASRTPFPYLGNGWTDCDEIWCVVRDPLAKRFTEVDVRYVRACASVHARIPFPYLRNGSTDCTEIWCVARGPVAMCFTQDERCCTNASVTVTYLSKSIRSRSFIA